MSAERKESVVSVDSIVFYLSTRDDHTLAYVMSQHRNSFNLFGARNKNPTKSYIILFDFVCCALSSDTMHRVKIHLLDMNYGI